MTDLERYAELVEEIFGPNVVTFETSKTTYNHVIGALNNEGNFSTFKANFKARLIRLRDLYANNPAMMTEIHDQVNNIARRGNWQGAFAELAAYDFLNYNITTDRRVLSEPLKLNVTLPAEQTFAKELGSENANLDICVEDFGLYMDVKVLKDNVTEILDGLFLELERHLNVSNLNIMGEHDLHISYREFQEKRKELLNELKQKVTRQELPTAVRSEVIDGLIYRIKWEPGLSTVTRSYHPFEHAQLYHDIVFDHADKFLKRSKTMLVYVSFPWYNGVVTDFAHSNTKFYRSMARRVFCQYLNSTDLFHTVSKNRFTGSETIFQVSQGLSGIMFLEDDTILSEQPNLPNVKSYLYYNPNAVNKLGRGMARNYLAILDNKDFDDFEFDNY